MEITFKLVAIICLIMFFISEFMFFKYYILRKCNSIRLWTILSILLTTVGTYIIATFYINVVDTFDLNVINWFSPLQSFILGVYMTFVLATMTVYLLYYIKKE